MMKRFSYGFLLSLLALTWACQPDQNKDDEARQHLPQNATMVVSYTPKQLMEKAGYDEAMQWPAFQEVISKMTDENPYFSKILQNPAASGVDLDKRFYFALEPEPLTEGTETQYSYWLFSIADPDAFAEMWKKMELPAKPTGNNTYFSESGQTFLSWTDTWGIAGNSSKKALQQRWQEIIDLNPKESLAANANFQKCLQKEADLAVWMGSNGLVPAITENGLNALGNFSKEDLQDNYLHHFVNFEDGRIRAESDFFIKKKIRNDLDLFFRDQVRTDFTKALPAGKLEAAFSVALNPKGINQILIEKYAKRALQEAVKAQGLSFDDLLEAVDGDMALTAYTIDSTEVGLFVAKIGDKAKLNTLLEAAQAKEIVQKKGDNLYAINFEQKVTDTAATEKTFKMKGDLLIKGDLIYLGDSELLFQRIQAGDWLDGAQLVKLKSLMKENIFSFLAPQVEIPFMEEIDIEEVSAHANRKGAELIIELNDQQRNSLYQLMQVVKQKMEEKTREGNKKI